MLRLISILVGLGFVFVCSVSLISGFATFVSAEPVEKTAEYKYHEHPKHDAHWSFAGPFGQYEEQQLQRGFQVFKEVCAGCHGLNLVAFRNLQAIGYSEAEVRAIANQWAIEVPSLNPQTGEPATRKALPTDRFPSPYANDIAARAANNNAIPPDLSLIVKAREGGYDYIHSLLTGYQNPPADVEVPAGLYYNPYFHSIKIAMPPPLINDGQVTYADGTAASVDQMSQDVTAFLTWAAEPNLETRHQMGWTVLTFLFFATLLAYFAYRNVWADRKVKKTRRVAPAE